MKHFAQPCREPGCYGRSNDGGGFCPDHSRDNYQTARTRILDKERKKDKVFRLYDSVKWTKLKRALEGMGNVICQRIERGERYHRPVEVWHHVFSPRTHPHLFFEPMNLRGVCRFHHPNTEGEPQENLARLNELYAPTIWTIGGHK